MRKFLHRLQNDESLMLAYQRGDSAAFETVYQRHKNAVFAFLIRSGAHPDSVEEIFHEAWTAIIRNIERYKTDAKFKTYLYRVAHNKLIDHWRKRKHEDDSSEVDEQALDLPSAGSELSEPEQEVLGKQLQEEIQSLPVEQRCALLLRHQGFSQREIAEITGTGTETVKSRLRYANSSLRQALSGGGES